ncbi:MAG: alpha/beta hydrolase [Desulfobacterota bacterium]|nr:alpha/beta hydrolase [Thermodesulfobacteriota bacterium]
MSRQFLFLVIFLAIWMKSDPVMSQGNKGEHLVQNRQVHRIFPHIKTDDPVRRIIEHPAFKGFSHLILLRVEDIQHLDMPLSKIGSLMPYHSHVLPERVVKALNLMINEVREGKTIFYDFFTDQQKQMDSSKKDTGLFFFRGKPGAPFAIVCPGGGFSYVGSLHEGFPHAFELSKRGYNAFVLRYRVGDGLRAKEDLAAAISYIFKKAEMFEVGVKNYSLWGSSAGARMVGNIASKGTADFVGHEIPKPRIVIIAYTGDTSFSKNFPPAFIMVSEDDRIVDVSVVDRRVENMRNAGIKVEYRKYKNAGHGFGLGVGTDAEGWIDYAIRFWETHVSK